jgi:hypothetical protein
MITTTTVLIAVAKLELTPSIPIFAKIETRAANTAESNAKTNHINLTSLGVICNNYLL